MAIILFAITSLTADFVQDKQSELFVEPQRSTGVLEYKAPDYLRWEYLSLQPLVWEVEGDKGNMNKQIVNMLMLIRQCVQGDFEAAKTNFVVEQKDQHITLTPRKRELMRLFRKIEIMLQSDSQVAKQVVIYEANGDCTTIRFSNIQMQ